MASSGRPPRIVCFSICIHDNAYRSGSCAAWRRCHSSVILCECRYASLAMLLAPALGGPRTSAIFPRSRRMRLGKLLFSEDGHLRCRLTANNMGADSGNDSRLVSGWNRQVQSFLRHDGNYDFTVDKPGVKLMMYAHQYNVPSITFFINAAPQRLLATMQRVGWTWSDDKLDAYATYNTDSAVVLD
ncbi:hypothetical protein MRB53_040499 [Persea americana]|nr:hypothetical protein MRB53_040499 [Persea americana]